MITNRHRGLVRLHATTVVVLVTVFFWSYAEFIMRYVPVVRLSREVNLLPYFLCVVIGLLLSMGRMRALEARLTRLSGGEAAMLATTQVALVAFAVFAMMFATLDRTMSRLFLGTFLVGTGVGLFWANWWLPRWAARVLYGQSGRVPTLFIGRLKSRSSLETWLAQRAHLGLAPAGFLPLEATTEIDPDGVSKEPWRLGDLSRVLVERGIGQVVLMDLPTDEAIAREIIGHCQARGCRLLIQQKVDELVGHPVVSVNEGGYHFLALHEEPLEEPLNRVLKRLFDLAVALPVLVFVLPLLMVVVAVVQRWQSPGPLFHVRPRSGAGSVEFPMWKFRTMRVEPPNPQSEGQQATADDARVYPLGRWLRRHSLDEFPQFWNVVKGEMSVVGPRPVMPLLDAEFARQVSAYRSKHWVKPGITGLAQSDGYRGEIKTPEQLQERIRRDLYYLAHWSIWLDAWIVIKTAWQVVRPPTSAY